MIVINCSNAGRLGPGIAKELRIRSSTNEVKRLPDNELYTRLRVNVKGKEVLLVQSLALKPDQYLIELLYNIRACLNLGADKVKLLIPYLAYMRQDKQFKDYECVSQHAMAYYLNKSGAKELITVDPHLHRIKSLNEIFKIKTKKITAVSDIALYIKNKLRPANPVIIGPDIESSQWSELIANELGVKSSVFLKERLSATKVNVKVNESFKGKDVIIIDDIVSTGGTMLSAGKKIRKCGAKSIHCITTHGLFLKNINELRRVFDSITSTNTIPTDYSKIDLSKTIAGAIK